MKALTNELVCPPITLLFCVKMTQKPLNHEIFTVGCHRDASFCDKISCCSSEKNSLRTRASNKGTR